jgi:hypothetical protein
MKIFVLIKIVLIILLIIFTLCTASAQIYGCTDSTALNYNPAATQNDGSCIYDSASVSPVNSWVLPQVLRESSGIIFWNGKIWTHNDDTDINIYSLDTNDVNSYQIYSLTETYNNDWEEISQDFNYIYIGDFGNNSDGNRTDLKILRIEKNSLLAQQPIIDTISFSYSLQTDFTPQGSNNTDFDCEAFIVSSDSIYLFTKEWVSGNTSIYSLPKQPGSYIAQFHDKYNAEGLITGATYLESERIIVLCGYNPLLQPFLILLYDFQNHDFFSGNKRKVSLNLPFHQIEGIASINGLLYYLSNEKFDKFGITTEQKLHKLDLTKFLSFFLTSKQTGIDETSQDNLNVSYNPFREELTIKVNDFLIGNDYLIFNISGKLLFRGNLSTNIVAINIEGLDSGMYFLFIDGLLNIEFRKIIKF